MAMQEEVRSSSTGISDRLVGFVIGVVVLAFVVASPAWIVFVKAPQVGHPIAFWLAFLAVIVVASKLALEGQNGATDEPLLMRAWSQVALAWMALFVACWLAFFMTRLAASLGEAKASPDKGKRGEPIIACPVSRLCD